MSEVVIELRMDDSHGAVPLEACSEIIKKLKQHLELKVSPLLEPEVRHQHLWRHRVRTLGGTFIGSERRHIDNVLHALGLEAANTVPTPSLASGQADGDPLTQEQHRLDRSRAGSLLYISHDRPYILWGIGFLSGRLSAPHDVDMKRLVRVARYLKGQPKLRVWLPAEQELWSDANWAAPDSQRKSVSCGVIEASGCVLHSYCRRQSVIALSSAESELYALSAVALEGRLFARILELAGFYRQVLRPPRQQRRQEHRAA